MYDKYVKFIGPFGKTIICKFESYSFGLVNRRFVINQISDDLILEKLTSFLEMPNLILLDLTPKEDDKQEEFDGSENSIKTLTINLPINQFFKPNGFHNREEHQSRVRIINALRRSYIYGGIHYNEIQTVEDLINLTKKELSHRRQLGKASVKYIIEELNRYGLELKK